MNDLQRARNHIEALRQPPRLSWRTVRGFLALAAIVVVLSFGLRALHRESLPAGQDGRPYHHAPAPEAP